jgi:hypothetical protein
MESAIQLALPLFDVPSFYELLSARNATATLTVAFNKRFKRGWQVRISPAGKTRQLRIPPYLADAPEEIKLALIDWALLPSRPRTSVRQDHYRRKKQLERIIWSYIGTHGDIPPIKSRFDPKQHAAQTRGRIYDLREIFDSVNAACFNGSLSSFLRWGAPRSRTSCHMIKIDPAGNRVNLITIAGVYNLPNVPRYAIETIMHHEMLHIAVPPLRGNGRSVIHGSAFKTAEKKFKHYLEWRDWERTGLPLFTRRKWRRFE